MDTNLCMASRVYRTDGSVYFVRTAAYPEESIGYLSKAFPMDNDGNILGKDGNIVPEHSEPDPIITIPSYKQEDAKRANLELCNLLNKGYIMGP